MKQPHDYKLYEKLVEVAGKLCNKCKQTKPLTEFYKKSDGKPTSQCRICKTEYGKEWYKKNHSKARAYQKEYSKL